MWMGLRPYQEQSSTMNVLGLVSAIASGLRPQVPDDMPQSLSSLLKSCWSHDPDERPAFVDLVRMVRCGVLLADSEEVRTPAVMRRLPTTSPRLIYPLTL